jgi:uncharacterized membrane protein
MFADWVYDLVELAVWVCALVVLAVFAVYVVRKVLAANDQAEPPASKLLSKLREMNARGVLSDAEFRTIKTSLSTRLADELKDTGEKGCDD